MKLGEAIHKMLVEFNRDIPELETQSYPYKSALEDINQIENGLINEDLSDIKSELNDLQHKLGLKDWRD